MITGSLVKCERCDGTGWGGELRIERSECPVCMLFDPTDDMWGLIPSGRIALPVSPYLNDAYPEWLTTWTNPENEETT